MHIYVEACLAVFIHKVTANGYGTSWRFFFGNMLELQIRAAVYLAAMRRESAINAMLNLCRG